MSYWEQGKFDIDTESLKKLSDYFDCSVDFILGITDNRTPKEKQSPEFPDDIPESNKELYSLAKQVPPERQQEALTYLRFLIDSSSK